jgi:hypothetical protein
MDPLTLDQASELVEKLPFDADLKSKFLKDLRSSLFEKHESFLSNPLLLSIMLLTYGQSADIPNKLNVFYNQAYETLFQRHDALKGGFQRDRSCNLDIQDFARVFSAFSLQTYDKRIFNMSESQALEYLEKSKKILGIEFDANNYLTDAKQAVCLLIEDGLLIAFSHRSFQEYFTARFICNSKPDVQKKLIDKYSENMSSDSVMDLLYEMNPELVECTFIIPGLEMIEQTIKLKKKIGITHYLRYLKAILVSIEIRDGKPVGYYLTNNLIIYHIINFTLRHCGHLIGWDNSPRPNSQQVNDWGKYGEGIIRISSFIFNPRIRNEFVHDMDSIGNIFSRFALESVFSVKKALIKKHKNTDSSLEEIFGNRT